MWLRLAIVGQLKKKFKKYQYFAKAPYEPQVLVKSDFQFHWNVCVEVTLLFSVYPISVCPMSLE